MDDFVTTITNKDVPRGDFLPSITKEPQNFDEATKHHGWIQDMKLKKFYTKEQSLEACQPSKRQETY
jgi:hypothetical protein